MFQYTEGLTARIAQKEKFEREIQELELQLEKEAEISAALNRVHENAERALSNAIRRYLQTYNEIDRWDPIPPSPRLRGLATQTTAPTPLGGQTRTPGGQTRTPGGQARTPKGYKWYEERPAVTQEEVYRQLGKLIDDGSITEQEARRMARERARKGMAAGWYRTPGIIPEVIAAQKEKSRHYGPALRQTIKMVGMNNRLEIRHSLSPPSTPYIYRL